MILKKMLISIKCVENYRSKFIILVESDNTAKYFLKQSCTAVVKVQKHYGMQGINYIGYKNTILLTKWLYEKTTNIANTHVNCKTTIITNPRTTFN